MARTALILACLALGGIGYLAISVAGAIRSDQVDSCRRGNVVRAADIIDARDRDDLEPERRRVAVLSRPLDCEATLREDRPVPLRLDAARRYVQLIEHCQRPTLDAGEIVGSTPFPRSEGGRCPPLLRNGLLVAP